MLAACDLDGPMPECDYGVRLRFHYSREGSANRLRDYVPTITDYLYNSQGSLLQVHTRTGASVLQRTLSLPAGRYTLISWGNLAERTLVSPSTEPGTPFGQMQLVRNSPGNSDRLHYGRAEFTVSDFGVQQQTVFMGHAYLDLTVTVVGLQGEAGEEFTFRLDGTHPVYGMDHYKEISAQGFPMYIPRPDVEQEGTQQLTGVRMSSDGTLRNEFLAFRLTNDTRPVFSVWKGEERIIRDVDLKRFFDTMLIDMDTNECQEFDIRITVDGDNIYVQFVSLGDWIDGGTIG